jgi:hypothetical protein
METIANFLKLNFFNMRGIFVVIHWACVVFCVFTVLGIFPLNWIACVVVLIFGLLARELAG